MDFPLACIPPNPEEIASASKFVLSGSELVKMAKRPAQAVEKAKALIHSKLPLDREFSVRGPFLIEADEETSPLDEEKWFVWYAIPE